MTAATSNHSQARYVGLDLFRPLSVFGVVLIHVSQVWAFPPSIAFERLVRARDCAFPVIVMTSFFVLTRSLMAGPSRRFGVFVARRFRRLVVPCVIWTLIYWLLEEVAAPLWRGAEPAWPPASLLLSGYDHLWFLPFLFVGSVFAYPAITFLRRHPRYRAAAAGVCVALAAAYWVSGSPVPGTASVGALVDGADKSLRIGLTQSMSYAKYPLLGAVLGLLAERIDCLNRDRAGRIATAAVAAAACAVHIAALAPQVSRAVYSVAVFVVLLGPWAEGPLGWLLRGARYSYAIYIIHPALAGAVPAVLAAWSVDHSAVALLGSSAAVFALSGAAAVLFRRLVRGEWFLPLVPVGKGRDIGASCGTAKAVSPSPSAA